ncbi:MAG: acyl-CoA dehydrogenase family protein [Spirochaetota bacterium]|nr:acyl-CoA dehydrogenase family protein [Spirochaetota bacterium]
MSTTLRDKHLALQTKISHFAEHVIALHDDLYSMDEFPFDIWSKMGSEDLLGLSIPKTYGGIWQDYLSIVVATETMVRRGHNIGLALSWIIHLIISRLLILNFGNCEQRNLYLFDLSRGKITASIAVSEPETGANPKRLMTSAHYKDGCYIINGEKAFLSNGPIADIFVVFAVTGVHNEKNQITAFLVPADTAGLSIIEKMSLNFLRPSPHCGITLTNCSVPANNILGNVGSAYEDMMKPFRELEETIMFGPIIGGMQLQIDLLLSLIEKQGITITDELREAIGELQSMVHALRIISYEAACLLDKPKYCQTPFSLMPVFRRLSRDFQSLLGQTMQNSEIKEDAPLDNITKDLVHINDIGRNVIKIKQRKFGNTILNNR